MQGNEIIAILFAILLSVVALGWAIYCWCYRHVKIGVMISQAHARVARDLADPDPERGQHIDDPYIPRYTWQGWVRAKRPQRPRTPREPEYVILRTIRPGNGHSEQRIQQPNTRPNQRGQGQKNNQKPQKNPQKGKQQQKQQKQAQKQQKQQQKDWNQPKHNDKQNTLAWENQPPPGAESESDQQSPAPTENSNWKKNNAAVSEWDQAAAGQQSPTQWSTQQESGTDWPKGKKKGGKQRDKKPKDEPEW